MSSPQITRMFGLSLGHRRSFRRRYPESPVAGCGGPARAKTSGQPEPGGSSRNSVTGIVGPPAPSVTATPSSIGPAQMSLGRDPLDELALGSRPIRTRPSRRGGAPCRRRPATRRTSAQPNGTPRRVARELRPHRTTTPPFRRQSIVWSPVLDVIPLLPRNGRLSGWLRQTQAAACSSISWNTASSCCSMSSASHFCRRTRGRASVH